MFTNLKNKNYKQLITLYFPETGGLFGLAVRLMQLFSTTTIDMNPLMAILGLYFQIRDDYANLNLKEVKSSSVTSLFKVQYSLLHG